jgi:hypothetical protein
MEEETNPPEPLFQTAVNASVSKMNDQMPF